MRMTDAPGEAPAWPFAGLLPFSYRVILADPPWAFSGGGARAAKTHYSTMPLAEIRALPVGHLAGRDCALFLWVTDPLLDVGIETLKAWGFVYVTRAFEWAKRSPRDTGWHLGNGYYTRSNPESCLLGMTGSLGLPKSRAVRQLIVEPVRQHSRKPDRIRSDIEQLFDGPWCELFARSTRPGWDCWGNEVGKFEAAA